jgi:alginate O-acetyltransferase complex protein AlgI
MVFSSHLFIFYFLPLALLGYYLLPRRGQHVFLTLVSYLFYGWANPLFVVLMLVSSLIDYIAGLAQTGQFAPGAWSRPVPLLSPIDSSVRPPSRWSNWLLVPYVVGWLRLDTPGRTLGQKLALLISLISNLALLGFFKYFNFGIDSWNAAVTAAGWDASRWDTLLRITLPLGISFYTFQSMSYAIDVYRGDARAIRHLGDFLCYVAMFPQLVAGPIVRFQDVADQFATHRITPARFARGVAFFALGLGKKTLLANPCGKVADTMFDAGAVGFLDAWQGAVAYAFQIYFDFSAYSDMAIGLALMLGWVFAKNFDSPYRSQSITEFWRRWHLSLSTWLRDNLYIPLGGNKLGEERTYFNLALVMVLGGLWHGASWNFVIWGAIHGIWLGVERALGQDSFYARLPAVLRVLVTFVIVCFAWVFFRAKDLASALAYCRSMLGFGPQQDGMDLMTGLTTQPYFLVSMALAAVVVWACPQTWDFTRRIGWLKAAYIFLVLLISLAVMETQAFNPFIYFIF